jgi:BON domain-containing protein
VRERARGVRVVSRERARAALASSVQLSAHMAQHPSYDDIVRRTVIDPDTSRRPTREQEKAAREGFRALDDGERKLYARVSSALLAAPGVDLSHVKIEVDRNTVILYGRVSDTATLRALEDAIARVPGVETIHNQTVVG